jgi:hypothetical protein
LSFGKYLAKIRLEKAKRMILTTNKPLTEIAIDCGFCNVKMLYRVFKNAEGCSPSEYRQSKMREQKSNLSNEKLNVKSYNNNRREIQYTQYIAAIDDRAVLNEPYNGSLYGSGIKDINVTENIGQSVKVSFNSDKHGKPFVHYWKKLICAPSNMLLPATLAGHGPDVAMQVSEDIPVNYGMRKAVMDLSQFEDFEEVAARFHESALLPYRYEGGYMVCPSSRSFRYCFTERIFWMNSGLNLPKHGMTFIT